MVVVWEFTVLTLIGLLGLSGNMLSIITLLKTPNIMGESQFFVINQSVVDIFCSVMLLLSHFNMEAAGLELYIPNTRGGELLCKVWYMGATLRVFITASTYSMVCLTFDRFLKIVHPLWCRKHYTPGLRKTLLVFPWIFGLLRELISGMLLNVEIVNGRCDVKISGGKSMVAGFIINAVDFFIPVIFVFVCYCCILVKLRSRSASFEDFTRDTTTSTSIGLEKMKDESRDDHHARELHEAGNTSPTQEAVLDANTRMDKVKVSKDTVTSGKTKSPENSKQKMFSSAERKVTMVMALVSTTFFLCYISKQIIVILGMIFQVFDPEDYIVKIVHLLAFVNCAINPLIYTLSHHKMRSGLLKICCAKCRGQ